MIDPIKTDRRTLPDGQSNDAGLEARQVFDLDMSGMVTEYRTRELVDKNGKWLR